MKNLIYPCTFILLVMGIIFFPCLAFAYVGPGAGLSAIGAFFAIIAGILAAIFGFLWYPIKRLIRKRKQTEKQKKDGTAE